MNKQGISMVTQISFRNLSSNKSDINWYQSVRTLATIDLYLMTWHLYLDKI
jgi:hypothetical protein